MTVLIRPISSSMLSSSLKQAVMIDIFFFMVVCAPRLLESYDEEPVGYTNPLFHIFNPSTLIMSEPETNTFSWFSTPKPIKFLVVGAVNTVFGYSCYAGLLFIGLHYSLAALFGTLLGVVFNYLSTSSTFTTPAPPASQGQ